MRMSCGSAGSISIFFRSRLTSVSTLRPCDERLLLPDPRQQPLPREDDARIRREDVQQVELLARDLDRLPAHSHAAARRIELDAGES